MTHPTQPEKLAVNYAEIDKVVRDLLQCESLPPKVAINLGFKIYESLGQARRQAVALIEAEYKRGYDAGHSAGHSLGITQHAGDYERGFAAALFGKTGLSAEDKAILIGVDKAMASLEARSRGSASAAPKPKRKRS